MRYKGRGFHAPCKPRIAAYRCEDHIARQVFLRIDSIPSRSKLNSGSSALNRSISLVIISSRAPPSFIPLYPTVRFRAALRLVSRASRRYVTSVARSIKIIERRGPRTRACEVVTGEESELPIESVSLPPPLRRPRGSPIDERNCGTTMTS